MLQVCDFARPKGGGGRGTCFDGCENIVRQVGSEREGTIVYVQAYLSFIQYESLEITCNPKVTFFKFI